MEFMESDLTCCVCLEIFVYPLMLPCTHNLCRKCVQGLMNDGTVSKFNCPKCRFEVQVERHKGINSLPRNLALDNLATLFRNKAKISTEKVCGIHTKSLEFYCQTCKCLVCSECSSSDHSDFPHNVASINQLIADEKNSVQDLTDQMNDIEAELNKNIRTVQKFTKNIKLNEEVNCSTIEQSLGQLVAAINTLKDVFIKKIQQESQQQIDKLDNLEQDYRRLQLDINALRTQLASQDSSDPIQQYTAYQNMKMRVSSFLAFKLFKVETPPQSLPTQPMWRLHNAQHVYQAIQSLDMLQETLSPGIDDGLIVETSHSLPASPKHLPKPSVHQQNSEEYNSDSEGLGHGKGHENSLATESVLGNVRLSVPVRQPFRENLDASALFTFNEHNVGNPLGAEFSPVSMTCSADCGNTTKDEASFSGTGLIGATASPAIPVSLPTETTFENFAQKFTIDFEKFFSTKPQEKLLSERTGNVFQSRNPELPAEINRGLPRDTRPTAPDRTTEAGEANISEIPTEASTSVKSPSASTSSENLFGNQTFSFTVGSSDRRPKSRGVKVKKRDHSAGRSHPKK